MKKKLQLLEQLQSIDTAIDKKKLEQAEHQAVIAELDQNLALLREILKVEQDRQANLELEKTELETNLQSEIDNIKRSETNMKEIRTNKEFQAVGREITAARKLLTEIEDNVLQKVGLIEEIQAVIDTRASELASLENESESGRQGRQSSINALQTDIDASIARREQIIKEVPASVIRRYTQLREQRRGQAIAEARDGSCQGCNINLPPQLYNTLFKGEELHYCPHCQRILILKQDKD